MLLQAKFYVCLDAKFHPDPFSPFGVIEKQTFAFTILSRYDFSNLSNNTQ